MGCLSLRGSVFGRSDSREPATPICVAIRLLDHLARGYDSSKIVEVIEQSGATAVIPSHSGVKNPRETDFTVYGERYRIECFFNRLKHYRAVATRYAKRACNVTSLIYLAASMLWMK